MTHIDTEQRNPYYIDFLSQYPPDIQRDLDLSILEKHAEVNTYDKADPIIATTEAPKWSYEGIGSNADGEKCYLFELTQWPATGNRKLLTVICIPLGLFHRKSIYLPWSQELTEDNPLFPALQAYLEKLESTPQEKLSRNHE